jgi:murein DD-endopeptidase MepM/ murein hydrolase activator NlpD
MVVSILPSQPMQVYADNTEDLLNVYGLTLGGPVTSDIEDEINSIENDLQSMQAQQTMNEQYNAIMEEYIAKREEELNDVLDSISVYKTKNDAIASEISSDVLTADINTLLQLDGSYKSNVSNMDSLLSVVNDYKLNYSYKSIESDLSSVEQQLEDAKALYVEAVDAYDLGDVKNIQWILPNDKYVTSTYGYRVDPLNHSEVRFHAGTDYRAAVGTKVGALFNGTVSSCGWSDTIGYFVTVECGDNVKYLVCHLSEIKVKEGQEVKQYQTIALSGGTGSRCTGPHLHLALYLDGVTYGVDELFQ